MILLPPEGQESVVQVVSRAKSRRLQPADPTLFFAHYVPYRDAAVWARFPLNLALRWWEYRWRPVAWLIRHGVLQCEEGALYSSSQLAPLSQWKLFA